MSGNRLVIGAATAYREVIDRKSTEAETTSENVNDGTLNLWRPAGPEELALDFSGRVTDGHRQAAAGAGTTIAT